MRIQSTSKGCKAWMIATAMIASTASVALAIPAKPTPIVVTQPDGQTITIQLRGDERNHYILTEDNYLAVESNGYYYYASTDADGNVVNSQLRVKPIELRTSQDRAFLSTIDMPSIFQSLEKRAQRNTARRGMAHENAVNDNGIGLFPGTHFPAMGDQKGLVVLVEYTDKQFTIDDPHDYFSRMLNEPQFSDYDGTGSAKDFFTQNSKNQFTPQFDVYGPITLAHNVSYYGGNDWSGNDQRPHEMAIEACQQLDDEVDFTEYDRDGDGKIDNIFIFYAGMGEASGGASSTVWPHSWEVSAATSTVYKFDNVKLDNYACSNEWEGNRPDGVGTFIHEFSHVLGLPDLYATSYTSAFTPGSWSTMDYGPYNNDGRTPPNYSIYERYSLGWITPQIISEALNGRLNHIATSNAGYIIPTNDDNEFFLLENRQQSGWDEYLPGHGMLIWHVDYDTYQWTNNSVNNSSSHQYVDLEEANNSRSESGRTGNPFPGTSNVTSFTDDTTPNMRTWSGQRLGLPITDITETDGWIYFKVDGGRPTMGQATATEATDITAIGFTANWEETESATKYLLSVYTRDLNQTNPDKSNILYVTGYNRLDVGNVTSFEVTGLEPETTYYYTVMATDGYEPGPASDEISVTTGEPTFDLFTPVALEPSQIGHDSFCANWASVDGATGYYISVGKKELVASETEEVDFADGIHNLPEGWTTTSRLTYANQAYCGEAVPSLRLATSDAMISSPAYTAPVTGLKFWHRGSSVPEDNCLVIKVLIGINWQTFCNVPICNDAGGTITELTELPEGTHGVSIEYNQAVGKSSVAIDDIAVSWNPQYAITWLEEYTMAEVGNVVSVTISGLEPLTLYSYTVTATNGELMSRVSNVIDVETAEYVNAVNGIASDMSNSIRVVGRSIVADGPVRVFTIDGRNAGTTNLAPGIYIARTATQIAKIVIR